MKKLISSYDYRMRCNCLLKLTIEYMLKDPFILQLVLCNDCQPVYARSPRLFMISFIPHFINANDSLSSHVRQCSAQVGRPELIGMFSNVIEDLCKTFTRD